MSEPATFLEVLRSAGSGTARSNDELVRAIVPLLQQLQDTHAAGAVAPLNGVGRIYVAGGRLFFHDDDARETRLHTQRVEAIGWASGDGIEVVGRGTVDVGLDGVRESQTFNVRVGNEPITRPLYLQGYSCWELELDHHDALTDIFMAGLMLASLALSLDFTEEEELATFVNHRRSLHTLSKNLHPVVARAIVRMTELDRHKRAQDLPGLIHRLRHYREVDSRADAELDFDRIEGFRTADRTSRRRMILSTLQARLFDISRRNRLLHYKPTRTKVDLTVASVPSSLPTSSIRATDLFLWDGPVGEELSAGRSIRLDQYLRIEENPWVRGALDGVRSEDRRSRNELGFSQLRLVIAFLNWHDLKDNIEERVRTPLLLLPVRLSLQRGVRDSYVLEPISEVAEVNPVLRHQLESLYGLSLPDEVDLSTTDVPTFHQVLSAAVRRSEPGVTVHLLTRPQIKLLRRTARRRTDLWRRRSRASGRGLRKALGVEYSYSKTQFHPLGLQLYQQRVAPQDDAFQAHIEGAVVVQVGPSRAEADEHSNVEVSTQEVYAHEEAASGPYDWAVDLTHVTIGTFSDRKMTLVRDYDSLLEASDKADNPAFEALFSEDAREISEPPPAGDTLDLYTVVPADPTQAAAIAWARSGRSFIIQGPPGTGKSQTITNLIADFAARGKRVLFVCQKRAALDVVYHRLSQHGLDALSVLIHDSQNDKKAFVGDLRDTYTAFREDDAPAAAQSARDGILDGLKTAVHALDRFGESMEQTVLGGSTPLVEAMDARARLGPPPELAAADIEKLPPHAEWHAHRRIVHEGATALVDAGAEPIWGKRPVASLSRSVLLGDHPLATARDGLDTLTSHLRSLDGARLAVGEDAGSAELTEAVSLVESLAPVLPDRLALLDPASPLSLDLERLRVERASAVREREQAKDKTAGWSSPLRPADTETALVQARRFEAMFILFRWLSPAWWRLRGVLHKAYDFASHAVTPTYTEILGHLSDAHSRTEAVRALDREAGQRFRFEGPLPVFAEQIERLRQDPSRSPLQTRVLRRWILAPEQARAVLDARATILQVQALAAELFDDADDGSMERLEAQVEAVRQDLDMLPVVLPALRRLHEASPAVRRAVRELPLSPSDLDAAVADRAVVATLAADRPLAHFDAASLRTHRQALTHGKQHLRAVHGRAIVESIRDRFRQQLLISSLSQSELRPEERDIKTAYNAGRRVLEREFDKVMRFRSIRELSQGDSGTVVYDLKPIWLMSPLSISDTIPLDEQRFDVVIFDEASQIPLEEAMPTVMRAPQMIVVGDEKQLPPTSFFAAGGSGPDPEDEEAMALQYDLDAESFLSHAARRLPSTMLRWHYRSRSESLIRFSNAAFYAGKLLTIPDRTLALERAPIRVESPDQGDGNAALVLDRPMSYHRLTDSPYSKRRNPGEAAYIAHLLRDLLRRDSGHTLGIVAFSEAQQGAIEEAITALARRDAAFARRVEAEREREEDDQFVGLFVKNLENVQGDERDIIILSICYAPDERGKMRMNFGPINKGGGEKRLNVVFSRAKRHMAVVASIDHTAIRNEYNDGAMCFKRYLQYSEAASEGDAGAMDRVVRALGRHHGPSAEPSPASAVVEQLADALEEEGLVVQRDVGGSSFRVDLAVGRDDADQLAVAVIVDTPQRYDSADMVDTWQARPAVLEAFGWAVVPVLSKDWLANPASCVQRVLRALDDPASTRIPAAPPLGLADRVEAIEEAVTGEDPAADASPLPPIDLAAATVVFTGSLERFNRAEAREQAEAAGARVAKSLTRRTTCLIVGTRPGAIYEDAAERGVRCLDEAGFLEALHRASKGAAGAEPAQD